MEQGRSSAARMGLAGFWIYAGILHFVIPRSYEACMPPYLAQWKRELVFASGVAEVVGGVAVLPRRTRRGARWWLLATLVAVFPANVHMALNAKDFAKVPEPALWARLPFQGVFAWLTWRGTR